MQKTEHPAAVVLDLKKGYFVKSAKRLSAENRPLVMIGDLEEARRLSAQMNHQNEKD